MRRVGVLFVLFGVMLGVTALKAESGGLRDSMTLAAIGFVLLAAFTLAEAGSLLSLPRVTGYILAGTFLGPSIGDVLSKHVVIEMQMFNTLALGLIATAAGLELDARQIARLWKTLSATIVIKIILGISVVGGTLYAWETTFGTLALTSRASIIALASIFGALSIGTSPAIALAVTTELRSKGRLSDLVLGAAILKDLVVVVALAVSVTLAQGLVGNSVASGGHVIAELSRELGLSIGVGAALGGLLVLYLRYVRAEMLLFVAAMILVMAEASRALHLELLLVFIAAGFVVRNFSRFEHELMKPVQMVALPVFVVFFTNAGANIDLSGTKQVLPMALAITLARAAVYFIAGRVGGKVGGESSLVQRSAWLTYLPQAGVTLGLVGLAAAKVPSLSEPILTLGMAVVAINLLVGPITLRLALRYGGEIPDQTDGATDGATDRAAGSSEPAVAGERLEAVLAAPTDARIAHFARQVAQELEGVNTELRESCVVPWVHALRHELGQLLAESNADLCESIAAWSAATPAMLASDRRDQINELFRKTRQLLRQLPESKDLPFLQHHGVPQAGDGVILRSRKRWLRTRQRFSRRSMRPVHVAACARIAIESRLVRAYFEVARRSNMTEAQVLADLQRLALGHLERDEAAKLLPDRLSESLEASNRDLERALTLGVRDFIRLLENAGSPALPLSSVRYSTTEAEVRSILTELDKEATSWSLGLGGARHAVHLAAVLGGARRSIRATVHQSVNQPLEKSLESSAELLRSVEKKLRGIQGQLTLDGELGEMDIARLLPALRESFNELVWDHVERDAAHFRSAVSTHRVALEVRRATENLPQSITVTDARLLAAEGSRSRVPQVELAAATLWQDALLKGLLPGIDEDVRRCASAMVSITQRLREAEEIAAYALEQLEGEANAGARNLARDALGRAAQRLQKHATALSETRSSTSVAIHQRVDRAFESLAIALLEPSRSREKVVRRALVQKLSDSTLQLRELVTGWWDGLSSTLNRMGHSDVSQNLLSRYRKIDLDAVSLREYVIRHTAADGLPAPYARLFALEPLVGPRLFVAYRRQLATLVNAERTWLSGGVSSALVVGAHGTGRSSLINQCKLELSASRVVRPEPLQLRRDLGLIAALGVSIGASSSITAIARALSTTKTTVLVDDLEQWISPDLAGLAELERFLELVVRTSETAFWIVTLESSALNLFEELMPVTHAFGLLVRLEPLDLDELRQVIEERHRISGRALRHASAPLSAIRNRLPGLSDHDVTWRVLAGLSDGNLSRALSLWLQSARLEPDDGIEISVQRILQAASPFVGWLQHRDQALLAQLTRFGPLRQSRLSQLLGLGRSDIVRRLAFLRAAGLVEGGHVEQEPARIPTLLKPTVLQGLKFFQVRS